VFLGIFLDTRKHDGCSGRFAGGIAFLSGARVEVLRSAGFDASRTSFFMSNHVNLFDPFMLYCAIPQFVRGWELESHFKIPAYGWLNEALWQRAGAGCATAVGFEAYVAVDARRCRWGHQLDYFSGSQAHARRATE